MTATKHAEPLAPGEYEVEQLPRGVVRVTTGRTVKVECDDRGRRFRTTGTAQSHTASSGHTLRCSYNVVFAFTNRVEQVIAQ